MHIESGPTGERKVRTTLMFLMFAFMGAWFAYDGWIGYPEKNYKEHLDQLSTGEREGIGRLPVYDTVTEEVWVANEEQIKSALPTERRAALKDLFGGDPSFESTDKLFYFGPAYRVQFNLRDGNPSADQIIAKSAAKSATSIQWQLGLAAFLGVVSVFLLVGVIRVRNTKVVLDESGLMYNGRGPISWESMESLDSARFNEKGWVDLCYKGNGSQQSIRLDEYHIARFDEVIDEICARKGFENPLPVHGTTQENAS